MNFAIIDWIFSILILIFAIAGLIKGFIDNVFGKLALILGIFIAYLFYNDIAVNVLRDIKSTLLAKILSFLLIFVVVFLIVKLIQILVSKIFQWEILKSLDRTLGFFFGLVEGAAIVCLLILLLNAQPFFDTKNLFEGSFYYNLVSSFLIARENEGINV